MKFIAFLTFSLCIFLSSAHAATVTIPSGTAIVVSTVDTISSQSAKTGDAVNMIVIADVKKDGLVVIKAGAGVLANIAHADAAGSIGAGGKLSLNVNGVYALDGSLVPVTGTKSVDGKDETTGTVVVGVVLCPLALLNEGDQAEIAANTQFRVISISDVAINIP